MKRLILSLILMTLSPYTFACSMGMGVYFKQGLPGKYFLEEEYSTYISSLVEQHIGNRQWDIKIDVVNITAPKVAENSDVIPIKIDFKNEQEAEKYSKIVVASIENIDVLRTRYYDIKIPHRNRQLPMNYQVKTLSMVKPVKLAAFVMKQPVSSLSTRFRVDTASKIKFMVILIPKSKKEPLKVVLQDNATRIHRCDTVIYVDGPLTEDLKHSYYYF